MLATVFLGFSPVVCEKKGGKGKMLSFSVKWIALPLSKIGFDRNFVPDSAFYGVSPFWIATSGGEGP